MEIEVSTVTLHLRDAEFSRLEQHACGDRERYYLRFSKLEEALRRELIEFIEKALEKNPDLADRVAEAVEEAVRPEFLEAAEVRERLANGEDW